MVAGGISQSLSLNMIFTAKKFFNENNEMTLRSLR